MDRRVFINAPVRRIEQDRKGVTVISDRVMARGKRVVVAMAPAVTNFIYFEPELPPQRAQLAQRYPQGSMIKCHALYDTPFWEEEGYTGEVIWDGEPCRYAFPGNPPEGKPGVMTGYIPAHNGRVWSRRTPQERREAVLRNFAEFFGPRALQPFDFREMVWAAEEYTRGGFAGISPPGVLLDFGEDLYTPVGRVHWSGTENAIEWYGTMEGAVRSGLNSAKEVLAVL
jgi:monoamine oxidase